MSMNFTGTNSDYVGLGQPTVLNLSPNTAEWTISLWTKSISGGSGTFICRGDSTLANRQYQFTFGGTAPYKLEATVGGTFYSTGVTGADDIWHHCVLRNFNNGGTYQFQVYKDVVQAGTNQNSGTATIACDTLLGARRATGNTGSGFLLTGSLSDVRVYNRALALVEIETIYALQGKDFIMNGLIGRWLLNEREPSIVASGSGIVKDSSNEANHGTPSGSSPTYDSDRLTFVRHENVSLRR
jgi:hypothetical protein